MENREPRMPRRPDPRREKDDSSNAETHRSIGEDLTQLAPPERAARAENETREFTFEDDDIPELFEGVVMDADDQISAAEEETAGRVKHLEASLEESGLDDALGLKGFADQLEKNSREMRDAAAAEKLEAERTITDMLERGGTADTKARLLANFAVVYPAEVMSALAAKHGGFDFGQKALVAAAAIGHEPSLASKLGELGMSGPEQRAALIKVANETPRAFIEASRAAGAEFSEEEKLALVADAAERDAGAFAEMSQEFGLSHESVASVIRSVPAERRKGAMQALRIPGSNGAKRYDDATWSEIGRMIEEELRPEMREGYEQVRAFELASRELMLAVAEEFPDRAAEDQERHRQERELQGRIKEYGDLALGSITSPLFLNIEGRALPAVYKPKGRETIHYPDGQIGSLRAGIELGGMAPREALAYLIDRALGGKLVPATVLRDGPEGVGSVQDWSVGRIAGDLQEGDGWTDPKYHAGLRRVGFRDYLIKRSDGHEGNWLIGFDGTETMIDNGPILGRQVNALDKTFSVPLEAMHGDSPEPEDRENAARFLGSFKTKEVLRGAFLAMLGEEDGKQAWDGFIERMAASVQEGFVLPDTELNHDQQKAWVMSGGRELSREAAKAFLAGFRKAV